MPTANAKLLECGEIADPTTPALLCRDSAGYNGFGLHEGCACVSSTTVVDRRLVAAIRAFGSGSEEHETGAVFAIATSGEDAQRRTILAREGV